MGCTTSNNQPAKDSADKSTEKVECSSGNGDKYAPSTGEYVETIDVGKKMVVLYDCPIYTVDTGRTWRIVGSVQVGDVVTIAGEATHEAGCSMVPIQPSGAIELEALVRSANTSTKRQADDFDQDSVISSRAVSIAPSAVWSNVDSLALSSNRPEPSICGTATAADFESVVGGSIVGSIVGGSINGNSRANSVVGGSEMRMDPQAYLRELERHAL